MSPAPDPLPRIPRHPTAERDLRLGMRGGDRWGGEEGLTEQLLQLVRRRKWIIVQAIVVVVAAALAYSLQQDEQYTASAGLLFTDPVAQVGESGFNAATLDPGRVAATNSALIQLPAVATYAARKADGISAGEIRASVTVDTGAGDADLATIEAVSSSPERAARIANAYAEGYIDFRRDAERASIASTIRQLRANLAALPADRQGSPEAERLRSQITALEAAAAMRTGGAELVQPAMPPTEPSAPKTLRNVVLAAIVGVVLGFLVAALVDRIDRRLRRIEDFERIYGLPVLAEIPRARPLGAGALRADAPDAEPLRMLRTNLRYLGVNEELRTLLVASPLRGEGKSTISRALATTMAAMGDHVVLVQADLHTRTAEPAAEGLSTVLVGASLDDALVDLPVGEDPGGDTRYLTVLPAGPPVPNPSELLESSRMLELLQQLEQHFDVVIIDAPATTRVSDALALVPAVSGVLIVGGLRYTTSSAASMLRQQLELLDGRPIGIAVNYAPPPSNGYGYGS